MKSKEFISALKKYDLDTLKRIPKADLHNHFKYGGTREYFNLKKDKNIKLSPQRFNSLYEMQQWQKINIVSNFVGNEGILERAYGTFVQAKIDNIVRLSLSVSLSSLLCFKDLELIEILLSYKNELIPKSIVTFELILDKSSPKEYIDKYGKEFIDSKLFYAIDCGGIPEVEELNKFVDIYNYARDKDLILKAHLGEFSTSEDLLYGIKILGLHEVNHGIIAAKSIKAMEYIRDNNIILNICPASNICLGLVNSYSEHPIKKLYRNGIRITISTDDLLLFGDSISQQYLNLFSQNVLTAEELNNIRLNSLQLPLNKFF